MTVKELTNWETVLLSFAIGFFGNLAATVLWDMTSAGGEIPKYLFASVILIGFGLIFGMLGDRALLARKLILGHKQETTCQKKG